MDNGSVPLWAFLVTGLAAVLCPWVTTLLTNRHATAIRAEESAADRRAWLDEHRVQTYRGAFQAMSHAARQLSLERNSDDLPPDARRTVTESLHDAEAEVALFATAEARETFHEVMVTWYETGRAHGSTTTREARTQFDDAAQLFTRTARVDLLGLSANSPGPLASAS